MKVHRELGPGFKEIIYKDALEIEFQLNKIPYVREKPFAANYLGFPLKRKINVDFIVYESIILEVKACQTIIGRFITTLLHYLKMCGLKLGIIANFGEKSLKYKRVLR